MKKSLLALCMFAGTTFAVVYFDNYQMVEGQGNRLVFYKNGTAKAFLSSVCDFQGRVNLGNYDKLTIIAGTDQWGNVTGISFYTSLNSFISNYQGTIQARNCRLESSSYGYPYLYLYSYSYPGFRISSYIQETGSGSGWITQIVRCDDEKNANSLFLSGYYSLYGKNKVGNMVCTNGIPYYWVNFRR